MRPVRAVIAVVFAAAVAAGCAAHPTTGPSAAPQASAAAPTTTAAPGGSPATTARRGYPPSTSGPSGGQPANARCDGAALRGSFLGTEGAAGTIWVTLRLRNVSGRTCTVAGVPDVRLLDAQGQPVTPPSLPDRPDGSPVRLRPGAAARLVFAAANVCDARVAGTRVRVTLGAGQGSLVVPLGEELSTCRSLRVRPLAPDAG
jgi:Protein of unknown function (DUF4232)